MALSLYINALATDVREAIVNSATDLTVRDDPVLGLELGDYPVLNLYFLTAANTYASFAGANSYTLTVTVGFPTAYGNKNLASTSSFTPISGQGWSGNLPLNTQDLADAVASQMFQNQGIGGTFRLQIQVTDNSGNAQTYALPQIFIAGRVTNPSGSDGSLAYLTTAVALALFPINLGSVTSLTGGGATALDGYDASTLPTGCVALLSYSNVAQLWKLIASTAATNVSATPATVRASNYSSNNRVWTQIG